MITILAVILGFLLGTLYKGGLNININKANQIETPKEYNESVVDLLDPSVREYYDQNNGLNKY